MAENQHPIARYRASQTPHLSQDALGDLVGVEGMTVYRWENRLAVPRPRHSRKLAQITGQPVEKIMAACMPVEKSTEAAA